MNNRTVITVAAMFFSLLLGGCTGEKKPSTEGAAGTIPDTAAEVSYAPKSLPGEPDIDSVMALDEAPMPVKTVNPPYPKDALEKGVEGMVWVKVLIDKNGIVKRSAIIKRTGMGSFEQAATEAIAQWQFKPGKVKNEAVDVWVVVPFRFKLKQS